MTGDNDQHDEHDNAAAFDEMVAAAMGGDIPHPVDWSSLPANDHRAELQRLWTWVVELARTWPVGPEVIPPCWYRHPSLVRVLSAARDAYLTAYDPTQAASAAADWMHVWDATVQRLHNWASRSACKSGEHQPDRIQRWVSEDEDSRLATANFRDYVEADYQARVAAELEDE